MDRRRFLLTSLVSGLVPLVADAQPAGKLRRIGWLSPGSAAAPANYRVPFVQELKSLGWVEGRDFVLEARHADGKPERLPVLAADLVKAKPDVIVAQLNPAVEASMKATSTIPIVMSIALDPVGRAYVQSLARPGGNVTGLSWDVDPKMGEKYVQLLRELMPRLSIMGILFELSSWIEIYIAATEAAATKAGVRHTRFAVRQKDDFDRVFAEMEQQHVQALRISGSTLDQWSAHRGVGLEVPAPRHIVGS